MVAEAVNSATPMDAANVFREGEKLRIDRNLYIFPSEVNSFVHLELSQALKYVKSAVIQCLSSLPNKVNLDQN